MCGIVGYLGKKSAVEVLVEGLERLEYRGYDSAGIAALEGSAIEIVKSKGKIADLKAKLNGNLSGSTIGIGHTRWATHGRPSDANAHPHRDCTGKIAVVHNGIIENYQELKEFLLEEGHIFLSETDTEVISHLIEHYYKDNDLFTAVQYATSRLVGSYALVVLCTDCPDRLIAARKDSPLIVGLGDEEYFFASDIPAILKHTRRINILDDGEIALITSSKVEVYNSTGKKVAKKEMYVEWDAEAAEKGGYDHFMIKEIHEQPQALQKTLSGRIHSEKGIVDLKEVSLDAEKLRNINNVAIVACGTAYHAGLIGKYAIEKLVRIPVEADIASEFRYRNPLIDDRSLVIVISQSGETADTLAALREAKKRGAHVIAVTNVVGSTVSREADDVLYTWAGPEIAVASTKAYTTQLVAMYLLALDLGTKLGTLSQEKAAEIVKALAEIPNNAAKVLEQAEKVKSWAKEASVWKDAFFIGRGLDWAVAMEGQLKLKEISYMHAEAYAAGELKHGTLALIEEGIPVIALATQEELYDKMVSNIEEVNARGANVTGVTFEGNKELEKAVNQVIYIPETLPLLAPILSVIPLQLLSYYAAVERGCDVDKPRNLAKSVTVE